MAVPPRRRSVAKRSSFEAEVELGMRKRKSLNQEQYFVVLITKTLVSIKIINPLGAGSIL